VRGRYRRPVYSPVKVVLLILIGPLLAVAGFLVIGPAIEYVLYGLAAFFAVAWLWSAYYVQCTPRGREALRERRRAR
jgi:hypothetical protein